MDNVALTAEILIVFGLLGLTIVLFVTEIVRIDIGALIILFLIGVVGLIPDIEPILAPEKLFSGLSSNAVVAIIAVMIIGNGLDRAGVMTRIARLILRFAGRTEQRVMAVVSGAVGLITSFMQNIGAAALFMPVVNRVSGDVGIPRSRLLIPMGFAAITGGTLTLVASSPLILLNDLMPGDLEDFGLFDVTPIGLALLATVIAYFWVLGRWVLPKAPDTSRDESRARSTSDYFKDLYGIDYAIRELRIGDESRLAGTSIGEFEKEYGVFVIGLDDGDEVLIEPPRNAEIVAGGHLAILGPIKDLETASDRNHTGLRDGLDAFARSMSPRHSGIAELIIPPGSELIGESIGELHMRQTYGLTVLRIQRGNDVLRDDLSDVEFQAGDTLVVHTRWERLMELEDDRDFIVMTSRYPKPKGPEAPCKVWPALASTAVALGLVLFSDLPLALALLGGALGMVLTGVLSMDDAYRAVSWKTVFLLAALIPLGLAAQDSGAAAWLAVNGMNLMGDVPVWVMQVMLFLLVTFFTLFISNVGATVLLVPLAVSFALAAQANGIDADPRVFALIVAIAASNAFLLPTHQVNALILDPGGYRVIDFLRAGGLLTLLYPAVALVVTNLLF